MKKSLFLCGALFALTAFVGCSDDDDPKVEAPTLKLSTNVVTVSADGTGAVVEVTTNQTSWKASRPEADVWCVLKQEDNKLSVSATANETLTARTTKVTVIAGTGSDAKTEEITVTQSAANAYLTVEGLEADVPVRLDAAGTVIEFTINTNAATWSATRPETDIWCTLTQDGNKLKIQAEAYTEDAERTTKITISGGAEPVSFDVVQKGEVPAAPIYAITIPTDFSKSYVQKVMVNGVKVAEICKEYIRTADESVDAQMIIAYPVINGQTDLTKGLVIENGGNVVWNLDDNTCAYIAGEATEALTTVYLEEGNWLTTVENTTVETAIEAELLVDTRPGDTKWSYKITKIGTQYWMAENLKARSYLDGTAIPRLGDSEWMSTESGAYRYNEEIFLTNGAFYNGYTMYEKKGLAPEGWIVPSDVEWEKLVTYVGPTNTSGKKFRSSANGAWNTGDHTNVTGFSAIGVGYYGGTATGDADDGKRTYWWSTTKGTDPMVDRGKESPKAYPLATGGPGLMNDPFDMQTWVKSYEFGFSIRCVKQGVSIVK